MKESQSKICEFGIPNMETWVKVLH